VVVDGQNTCLIPVRLLLSICGVSAGFVSDVGSPKKTLRVAALADLHYTKTSQGSAQPLLAQIAEAADVLVICGDLTDNGLMDEARALASDLKEVVRIPTVAVLGNHDFESGQEAEIQAFLIEAGLKVLDGDTCEVYGVGFAGVKGFAGGFDRGTLGPWGERVVKAFVQEAVSEALKLEKALARLRTPRRIALLHYSPVRATVEGEPVEIYSFLGCSRLEEPLNRYPVTAVFHGHAHHGVLEGKTRGNVAVYNVSLPLLRRRQPDRPYALLTIPLEAEPQLSQFQARRAADR
jgi:Icc-related predicted phosphoesterase